MELWKHQDGSKANQKEFYRLSKDHNFVAELIECMERRINKKQYNLDEYALKENLVQGIDVEEYNSYSTSILKRSK